MQGAAPEVALAKAERYQNPDRAPNLAALWDRLASWEVLGLEVEAGGHKVEDWVRVLALKRLVPKELAEDMATRPENRERGKTAHSAPGGLLCLAHGLGY